MEEEEKEEKEDEREGEGQQGDGQSSGYCSFLSVSLLEKKRPF